MSPAAGTLSVLSLTLHIMPSGASTETNQASFEDLEPLLAEVTFVVVDLETTGGSSRANAITEVGAVKVRGGEVIGEFATLVRPDEPIPPSIVMLTGITNAMVAEAPPIEAVLPSFLEFARGAVLVAHNAPFDIGFLKAATARLALPWPGFPVVDTVRLARAVFTRSELPSVRLGALAAAIGATVTPDHRAIHDARATVDVLHALIERLGPRGAQTLTDLIGAQRAVDPARQRKRYLADGLPASPGVYLFRDGDDGVLYVGTSGNLRSRVRSYFTAAETRARIKEMVLIAARVDYVVCATALEAHVREQRLIAAHQPRYNSRSKHPRRLYWIQLAEPTRPHKDRPGAGRLTIAASAPSRGRLALGPIAAQQAARAVVTAARAVGAAAELLRGDVGPLVSRLEQRMADEAQAGWYQQAAASRDALVSVVTTLDTVQRTQALAAIAELAAARPDGSGGWELTIIRHGRLAASGRARRGADPIPVLDALTAAAETVVVDPVTGLAASLEETLTLLAFLEQPGVRIARSSAGWTSPVTAAGRWRDLANRAALARDGVG